MASRRELLRRLGFLSDIAGIVGAMKALALMEIRILEGFVATQQRMVSSIEASAACFAAWYPIATEPKVPDREICIVVGSESGFCGDFNDELQKSWSEIHTNENAVIIGQRLAARCNDDEATLRLPGASVVDEVPDVLAELTGALIAQLSASPAHHWGVSALYHCHATGRIRHRRLLPLRDLPPCEPVTMAPELNLSPEEFFHALVQHYLYAVLNDVLYSSLMAENQRRHAQMDSALNKLDEDCAQLRLAYNAQRQEDITEEIEIILLAAELSRVGGADRAASAAA